MRVRLLTDGGYHSLIDDVGEVYIARKERHYYMVTIKGNEYVFYADEIEILNTFEQAEDKAAITTIVISIIATIICIAAIIYVIF